MGDIKLRLTVIVLGMALAAAAILCSIFLSGRVTLGRSLKVISTEPPSPVVLNVGEKFYVKFSYRLGPSDSVQIWVRPYTLGSKTAGYKAHGSGLYHKKNRKAGVAEGWFMFTKPTFVDEVCVYMRDCDTREKVHTVFYKVDVRWK